MKYRLLLVKLILLPCSLWAQTPEDLFQQPDSLLRDIGYFLENRGGRNADSLKSEFEQAFTSITAGQQKLIHSTASQMFKKGYPSQPDFVNYFSGISNALLHRNVPAPELTKFLQVVDTSVQLYHRGVVSRFLKTASAFFKSQTIFDSRYSSLTLLKGTFTFSHTYDPENLSSGATALAVPEEEGVLMEPYEEDPATEEAGEDKEAWFDTEPFDETESTEDDGWSTPEDDGWGDIEETAGDDGWDSSPEDFDASFEEAPAPLLQSFVPGYELPPATGPLLVFSDASLQINSVYDSVTITNVNGDLLLKNNTFSGNSAKFTWESLGIPADKLYADLKAFVFDIRDPEITAYEAELHYQDKLAEPVKGSFIYDSHLYNKRPDKALYPQFRSWDHNITVTSLVENINVTGGFALQGMRYISDSEQAGKTVVEYVKDGRKKFTASSQQPFTLQDSVLTTPRTKLVIHYSDEDSLSHPAVAMKYHQRDNLLQARRDKDGYQVALFADTRSDANISAEFLQWYVEADTMDMMILNARERIPLVVESKDYFDKYRFIALKGNYNFHPLQMTVSYGLRKGGPEFTCAQLAEETRQSYEVVRGAITEMARRGYVDYDDQTDIIKILRKGLFYFYVNMGKPGVDYDNMRIPSRVTDRPNLTISFDSADFKLEGVTQFMISDSMQVLVTPEDGKVNLKDGRNTSFGGEMRAGNFVFRGPEFTYNYDSFNVVLDVIDSISILVTRENGQKQELSNNIVNTGGILYISDPKNKSGKNQSQQYPILDAKKGGMIYFDGEEILDGSYDKSIRFEMPPFTIDSLNENNTDVITFDGTFKTEGMFPDFQQVVSIDKSDYSFGFKRDMGNQGVPVYNGKGHFRQQITLNNKGVRGNGFVDYLSGSFRSEDFIFYSDSVTTRGKTGEITMDEVNGVEFPAVSMEDYQMRWLVDGDSMMLKSSEEKPFQVFEEGTSFEGTMALTPSSLSGDGHVEDAQSLNESGSISFSSRGYNSVNSVFKIKTDDIQRPAMIGDYVEVAYNLNDRKAVVKTQDEIVSSFEFPFTRIKTNINEVTWNMDDNLLTMNVNNENSEGLGRFVAETGRSDSLEIFAQEAIYDLGEHVLNLDGVPEVLIANVRIKPDDGKVNIRENAKVDQLENAVVEINADDRYHVLTDASIAITSQNKFQGEGTYHYATGTADTFDIRFSDFNIKNKGSKEAPEFITTAKAHVDEDQDFVFLPGIKFRGDLILQDDQKYLQFDGVAALDIDREENRWFSYQSADAENHGVIMVDENMKEAGFPTKLSTGIYLSQMERDLYGTLVEFDRARVRDFPIFEGRGHLAYDEATSEYSVIPNQKREGNTLAGNSYIFNWDEQKIRFDGRLNLLEPEKAYMVNASGNGTASLNDNQFEFNTTFAVTFDGAGKATEEMGASLQQLTDGDPLAIEDEELVRGRMAQLLDERQLSMFMNSWRDGAGSWGKVLAEGITIADVKLKWSDEYRSLYSEGPVGVGNVFKTDVNSKIEGYIEIPKQEFNNRMKMFLMYDRENWFYFSFGKEGITALASNATFNYELGGGKGPVGLIQTAPLDDVLGFISQFRMFYLGTDELLDIAMPEEASPFASEDAPVADPFADEVFQDMAEDANQAGETTEEEEEEEDDDDGF